MKLLRVMSIIIFIPILLIACMPQQIKTVPFKQIKLPLVENTKSRIFFHHAGNITVSGAKVINEKTDTNLAILLPNECTFIDFKPGSYKFRAGHGSLGPNELITEINVEPGKTYYLIWWWNRDKRIGFHGSERGAHFMNLKADQGKSMIRNCNYKESEKLK